MADIAISLSDAQIDELLNQAEVRLLEKQKEQQSKGSVVPKAANNEVVKTNTPITATASQPAPVASQVSKQAPELSVRVPEIRKTKKEMVCLSIFSFHQHASLMKFYPNIF